MTAEQHKRIYVTFPNANDAMLIRRNAEEKGVSASKYIVDRLALLDRIERLIKPELVPKPKPPPKHKRYKKRVRRPKKMLDLKVKPQSIPAALDDVNSSIIQAVGEVTDINKLLAAANICRQYDASQDDIISFLDYWRTYLATNETGLDSRPSIDELIQHLPVYLDSIAQSQ